MSPGWYANNRERHIAHVKQYQKAQARKTSFKCKTCGQTLPNGWMAGVHRRMLDHQVEKVTET